MLLGSPKTFAVEFEVDLITQTDSNNIEQQAHFVFGHLCFWVTEHRIGNYELGGSLSVAAAGFKGLLAYRDSRIDSELWSKSTEQVFKTIDDALYVDVGQSDEAVARDWQRYAKFIAVPKGFDVFDGWKAYLVEGETYARYVWRYSNDMVIREAALEVDEFDARLREFLKWFEDQAT